MQQGDVQVTPVSGLEGLLGDAIVEGELVDPEGGHNAGPWSHHLLALVLAESERVGDCRLQCQTLLHHRAIDPVHQPRHWLDAAFGPGIGTARRCVGYACTRGELELDADLASLVANGPSPPVRCALQLLLPGLFSRLPRQGLRIKLVPEAFRCY